MYRLLIVDDLPIITDGLAEQFLKEQRLQLEVYKAYSGFEALDLMKKHRIDIVLSDILMPGMDGIELLREIRSKWSACKVILLTSHNDFHYVQSALSLGGLEYILKTEGDDKIVQSVEKAILALDKEHDERRLIEKAETHMKMALPALQKEYIWSLLQGKKVESGLLAEHFGNLRLPFHAEYPVFLLICRVDEWKEVTKAPDKALIIYAVQNIVEEFLSESAKLLSLVYETSKMVWILQPKAPEGEYWEKTFRDVDGLLEMIQRKCQELLKLTVSFVLSSRPAAWPELADRFQALKYLLVRGLGGRKGTLLTEQSDSCREEGRAFPSARKRSIQLQSKMPLLLHGLENGGEDDFYRLYEELAPVFTDETVSRLQKIELYHAMSYMFLTFVNKYELEKELGEQVEWEKLVVFDDSVPWQEWNRYFIQLASLIFSWNKNEQEESTNDIVRKIHEYIESHISTDISLIHLADHVHLNPSYLSRLYKQITGSGLSDYLSEYRDRKAKELLQISHLKVHEIAASLGYNSSHSFIRFFKKQNRVTPQEYREQAGL
ncbi:response regulator [Paenibacillus contaminans]|uniref:DNA-binding response regulator n=1 Tax=Paenibacillus contaminans TaxID=450362 RepID=A0A329MKT9_9BACL|nr:response regulator [Paenibacillus contaminans]RAV20404.1 DNA-binding response regulator [Paenibacillus contaminans]